jgi:hypothetical protein
MLEIHFRQHAGYGGPIAQSEIPPSFL